MVKTLRQYQPEQGAMVLPLTVKQYNRMIDEGILAEGEPYELVDGLIVRKDRSAAGEDPMTVGDEHIWALQGLMTLTVKVERLGCHLRTQQPVSLPQFNEPEPDASIAIGGRDDYKNRKPSATDIPCVIEVSQSSLKYDRTTKLRIYANGGIEQYVIVNLPDRVIELYTGPIKGKGRYARTQTLRSGQTLKIAVGGKTLSIPVRLVLP